VNLGSSDKKSSEIAVWPPKWGQERRLEFIDFRLFWDGRLNRADLANFFSISIPQASIDISLYQERAPGNIIYDRQEKAYLASDSFVPVVTSPDAHSFLNQIRQVEGQMLPRESTFLGWYPPSGVVGHPTRRVDAGTLRMILQSMRRKESVHVTYQSMNHPEPTEREIGPHAIAFDGVRWHTRAFCFEHNAFRDFVFARILSITRGRPMEIDAQKDTAWLNILGIVVKANPDLTLAQRRAIELDYGMEQGSLRFEVREALLFYLLQQLSLLPSSPKDPHQQIVLANREALEPYFNQLPSS
jgi:hypothetical protein